MFAELIRKKLLDNEFFKSTALSGGPLDGEYELWQFHAHWGDCNEKGSEHTVKGKMYSGEVIYLH